jgi:hypothetical protein
MPKENNNEQSQEESGAISDTGKDIKREMDTYQAKMKLAGDAPPLAGDSTRSEE